MEGCGLYRCKPSIFAHIFGLWHHLARSNRFGAIYAQSHILHFFDRPPLRSSDPECIFPIPNFGLAYTGVRSVHGRMTLYRCKSARLKSEQTPALFMKSWIFLNFDPPYQKYFLKNPRLTWTRAVFTIACYEHGPYLCFLDDLSTMNGLWDMERRTKNLRFFPKFSLYILPHNFSS